MDSIFFRYRENDKRKGKENCIVRGAVKTDQLHVMQRLCRNSELSELNNCYMH